MSFIPANEVLTQEEEDNEEERAEVVVGTADLVIVGIKHYRGVVHEGEYVSLVREPNNPYDRNAIKVLNLAGDQVGHIKATIALHLAKVMDDRSPNAVRLEAIIFTPERFTIPCQVTFFGPPGVPQPLLQAVLPLIPAAAQQGYTFMGNNRGGGGYRAPVPKKTAVPTPNAPAVVGRTVVFSKIKSQDELDALFEELLSATANEEAANTASKFVQPMLQEGVTLLPHQAQGLAWMLAREKRPDPTGLPPFWEERVEANKPAWFNSITNSSTARKPASVFGGILADDMGLGKTLQLLCLVASNPSAGVQYTVPMKTDTNTPEETTPMEVIESSQSLPDASQSLPDSGTTHAASVGGGSTNALSAPVSQMGMPSQMPSAPSGAEAPPAAPKPTVIEYADVELYSLKVPQLKEMARSLGVLKPGKKADHIQRIIEARTKARSQAYQTEGGASSTAGGSVSEGSSMGVSGVNSGASTSLVRSGPPDPIRHDVERPAKVMKVSAQSTAGSSAAPVIPAGPRGTLIVCPMSVLNNWEVQLASHFPPDFMTMITYHGNDRHQKFSFSDLKEADIVLTTYHTLAAELAHHQESRKQSVGLLFKTKWHRVVLDEAHTIRNKSTKAHKSCCALQTDRRWCLSGTPLQNSSRDIGSLFSFLKLEPVCESDVFKRSIEGPLNRGDEIGLTRLRVLLKSLCLRRTKSLLEKTLPPKIIEVHTIELGAEEREAYDCLLKSASAAFRIALAQGGEGAVMAQYSSVLECLLRLRQCCLSLSLIPKERLERAKAVLKDVLKVEAGSGGVKMTAEKAKELFARLRGALESDDAGQEGECPICLELLVEDKTSVIRGCGHSFCQRCITHLTQNAVLVKPKCALCRQEFNATDVISGEELKKATEEAEKEQEGKEEEKEEEVVAPPTIVPRKVTALLEALQATRAAHPEEKSVVFSQFAQFLDVIELHLVKAGFRVAKITGKSTANKRRSVLESFASSRPVSPEVMLLSLQAGGTGLNLTSANHVYMMDLWWNGSVEEQAMDRVHRIGQKRQVTVVRYVCKDTLEPIIMDLQEAKRALGKGALTKLSAEETRKARLGDLTAIFQLDNLR